MKTLEQRLKIIEYKLCQLERGNFLVVVFSYNDTNEVVLKGKKIFIYVLADEMNNGDSSLYVFEPTIGLKFLLTVP